MPPTAKQVPTPRTHHGDTFIDPFAWMADQNEPDLGRYIRAENAYADPVTAHLASLRDALSRSWPIAYRRSSRWVPVRPGWVLVTSGGPPAGRTRVYCRVATNGDEFRVPPAGRAPDG